MDNTVPVLNLKGFGGKDAQTPFPQGSYMYATLVQERILQDTYVISITVTQVCPHSSPTSLKAPQFNSIADIHP